MRVVAKALLLLSVSVGLMLPAPARIEHDASCEAGEPYSHSHGEEDELFAAWEAFVTDESSHPHAGHDHHAHLGHGHSHTHQHDHSEPAGPCNHGHEHEHDHGGGEHHHHHHHHTCGCGPANLGIVSSGDPLSLHAPSAERLRVPREHLSPPESPVFRLDRPPNP